MPLEVLQRLLKDSDIPPSRTKRFFKKADVNFDRRVNYDEFLRQVSLLILGRNNKNAFFRVLNYFRKNVFKSLQVLIFFIYKLGVF